MPPPEAVAVQTTDSPNVALVLSTSQLAVRPGGGSFTVNVKVEVLFEGDPSTVDPVTVISPVGVWVEVPMVNVDVQVFSVGSGEQLVGEKDLVILAGPLAEK